MRKCACVLLTFILCLALTACNNATATNNINESKIDMEEIAGYELDGTVWTGVDTESGDTYSLHFNNGNYELDFGENGDKKSYSGTYKIGENGINLNGCDLVKTPESVSFNIDGAQSYLEINGIRLTPENGKDVEELAESLNLASDLYKILNTGYCWIACSNGQALILYVNGNESSIKTVASLGDGKVAVQDLKGSWSLNGSNLSIYSDSDLPSANYEWTFEEEDDIRCLKLKSETAVVDFYQTKVNSVEEAIELANQYISNQVQIEEVDDITQLLSGYEGYSIVDALIMAGIDPSFENRIILAEKSGIDNYRGSAEQNLFLIEYMGGKVK